MRVTEDIRKTVVFLGIADDTGAFAPYGTGFIVVWPESDLCFTYVITAKHVIRDIKDTGRPLIGRINSRDGKASLGVLEIPDRWVTHPTAPECDIAVAPFGASIEVFDYRALDLSSHVLTQGYIDRHNVGPGDWVFTAGLLTRAFGTSKNIPVVRSGNIAAMPEEPIDLGDMGHQEVYLIESRSIGGLSGSPVFMQTNPFRVLASMLADTKNQRAEYLLGVNIGLFLTKALGDRLRTDAAERREHFLETMSAGIAVVVPIQRAIEIIRDAPTMTEARKKTFAERQKKSGFVLTSAAGEHESGNAIPISDVAPPASDENPTHREDFMRLVNAAAKTPPQGGRT